VEVKSLRSELLVGICNHFFLISIQRIGMMHRCVYNLEASVVHIVVTALEQVEAAIRQMMVSLPIECLLAVLMATKAELGHPPSNAVQIVWLHAHTLEE